MSCRISRDSNNEIMEVYAKNSKPSILWHDLYEQFQDKEVALTYYFAAFTKKFKAIVAQRKRVDEYENGLDKNGEPNIGFLLSRTTGDYQKISSEQLGPTDFTDPKYWKFGTMKVDREVEMIKRSLAFSKNQINSATQNQPTVNEALNTAESLSKRMNIPFEIDRSMSTLGKYKDGKVFINPDLMKSDTVMHEFSHPFVEAIRVSNPTLYANLSKRAGNFMYNGKSIAEFVKENNPELSGIDLQSEIITTALALEATKPGSVSDFKKFGEWLKTVFKEIAKYINSLIEDKSKVIKPEDLNVNMSISNLAQILNLDNSIDVSSASSESSEFNQTTSATTAAPVIAPVTPKAPAFNYAEDILAQNLKNNITLNESDPANTFYEKYGKKYDRLTNWLGNNISNYKSKALASGKSFEEMVADRKFQFKDKKTETALHNGKQMTYGELLDALQYEYSVARYKGKIIHAMIERHALAANKESTQEVDAALSKYYSESGLEPQAFKYIDETYIKNVLKNKLNVNVSGKNKDLLSPELTIISDVFGLGSTIDGLVQHEDGSVSLHDYKTGAAFLGSEDENSNFIDYGIRQDLEVKDTKLGRAKLELAMRAMMLKELYPDIKFREIKLVYLAFKQEDIKTFDVNLTGYVEFFSDYFRNMPVNLEKQANKEKDTLKKANILTKAKYFADIHKAAEKTRILDKKAYMGSSKIMAEDEEILKMVDKNVPIFQQIEQIEQRLAEYVALRDTYPNLKTESPVEFANLNKTIKKLTEMLTEASSGSSDTITRSSNYEDLGWFKKNLGNLYAIQNPLVQQVIKRIREWMDKVQRSQVNKQQRINKLTDDLKKETYERLGKKNIGGQNLGITSKDLFGFMSEKKVVTVGYTEHTDEAIKMETYVKKNYTKEDLDKGLIGPAQYAFYLEAQSTIEEMALALEKPSIYSKDKNGDLVLISRAEFENIDMVYFRKNWMPRKYKSDQEFYEGDNVKDIAKHKFQSYVSSFLIDNSKNPNPHLIPLKYQESAEYAQMANEEKLSHRWNDLLLQSYNNIAVVDNLQAGYAYSKVVQDYLMYDKSMLDEHYNTKFKQTSEWLNGFTKLQLVADKELSQYRSGRNYVNPKILKKIFGEERYKKLNLDAIFDKVNSFVTMTTMWFKPISGGFNTLLNVLMTSQRATTNLIGKYGFGINANEYDIEDFAKANADFFKSNMFARTFNDVLSKNEGGTGDKVKFLLNYFGFDSNKFSYVVTQTELNDAKLKIINSGLPFVFHQMGEEYSQITILLAQLNHMKTLDKNGKEISMYDAFEYDENTKSFKFNAKGGRIITDSAGNKQTILKTSKGEELLEPTFEENTKMKRTYERVHGGYKSEEKMMVEATSLGRFLVKFRKYIPSQVLDNFQSEYSDWSIGDWGTTVDEKGNPILLEGETQVDWIARNNEGRLKVFTKWLSYSSGLLKGDPQYQWQNLSDYQKKQVISLAVNVAYAFAVIGATAALFGGDDPDKLRKSTSFNRMKRLKEDMMPLNPFSILTYAADLLTPKGSGVLYGTNPIADIGRTISSPLIQPKQVIDLSNATWRFFFDGLIMGETIKTGKNAGKIVGQTQLMKNFPLASSIYQVNSTSEDFKTLKGNVLTQEEQTSYDNISNSIDKFARPGR